MNIDYCDKKCPIGIKVSNDFLDRSNSAFDAVIDFNVFVKECYKTCPNKEKHFREEVE